MKSKNFFLKKKRMKRRLLTITTATEDRHENSAQTQTVDQQATWPRVISPIVTSLENTSLGGEVSTCSRVVGKVY